MVIAIDFDDTLHDTQNVTTGYRMGIPTTGSILSMQRLAQAGHILWIFTSRNVQHPNQKKAVADWLDYFKIPYHGITNIKLPEMEIFIDNRALYFDTWPQVMARLTSMTESS